MGLETFNWCTCSVATTMTDVEYAIFLCYGYKFISYKCYILVGFRRAVIFSVKEYTNNELTKTKNKKTTK